MAGGYWRLEMRLRRVLGYGNAFGVEAGPECGGGGTLPPPLKQRPARQPPLSPALCQQTQPPEAAIEDQEDQEAYDPWMEPTTYCTRAITHYTGPKGFRPPDRHFTQHVCRALGLPMRDPPRAMVAMFLTQEEWDASCLALGVQWGSGGGGERAWLLRHSGTFQSEGWARRVPSQWCAASTALECPQWLLEARLQHSGSHGI